MSDPQRSAAIRELSSGAMGERGFILQPTYRIEAHRPVVHLYGRLASGECFLVRDDRQTPCFYLRDGDVARAAELGVAARASARTTLDGYPAARVDLRVPPDAPPLRERLHQHGIPTYQADVRFAMRYLFERGIRGSLSIAGASRPWRQIGRVFDNPTLAPEDWTPPALRVLSLDIETDPRAGRLLSIGLWGCGAEEVLLSSPEGMSTPDGARGFATEKALLEGLVARVRQLDPDVITGWNVIDFDLAVLDRLARRLGVRLALGRGRRPLRLRPSRAPWSSTEATITGRVVLDGIQLVRGAFVKMESWGLDAVARSVLGEGKTLTGHDRVQDILDTFQNDRPRFVAYNLTDARLVIDILERLQILPLAVERSKLTGLPIDRVSGSIAAFDFLYLSALHRRRIVAPSVDSSGDASGNLGGHVLEPEPGLYRNVLVFDFKSLYPSVIRTFQIDPLGYLPAPEPGDEVIVAPNGATFRRRPPGILTELLDALMPRREAAKAAGDQVASHAIKILMSSFYGVLGTPACRFFRPQLASAITGFGRTILLWSKARIESYGHRVLYGDTDSLFVLAGDHDPGAARATGAAIARRLNADLAAHVEATWGVDSRLELELETLYLRLFLHATRGGGGGARKRYAGLRDDGEVVFTGMEAVRRDATELAKRVQRTLYGRLFREQPVEDYLAETVAALRAGELDHQLVYRKGLGKPLEAYTATTPPHVVAARKLPGRAGRLIRYLMTKNGPEPTAATSSPIDHEHYVQKQIRPVAEPVLELLGLDFDRVIGDDVQMTLF